MASPTLAFIKLFRSIDLDLDNRITEEDLLKHQDKEGFSATFAKRWLTMFDKNNDGVIELEDFCLELGMTQAEAEEQIQMTTTIKVHAAKPPTPPVEEEEITVEVFACEMQQDMQDTTIEVVSKAAETYKDEEEVREFIESNLSQRYKNVKWQVEVDPYKKTAPDHLWENMIFFRLGEHKYLVSDRKKRGKCGCCYLCCI